MYDKDQVKQAIQAIKKFPSTTYKKVEHKGKIYELKNYIMDNIMHLDGVLFNPNYNYHFEAYKLSVEEYKTKKIMDFRLKLVLMDYYRTLDEILNKYSN